MEKFALVGAVVAFSLHTAAQTPGTPPAYAFTDTAYSALNLTPDQWKGIRELEARYTDRIRQLDPLSQDAYATLKLEREDEIKRILDAEQFERWRYDRSPRPPANMPTLIPEGPITPMPTENTDTLDHTMPVITPAPRSTPH